MNDALTMQKENIRVKGLSVQAIRVIAAISMICEHLWLTIAADYIWLHYAGRLAFPLFAFLVVEGFYHTLSPRKYLLRLLVLAVVSEIPFNMVYYGAYEAPEHQNVLWTLAAGLTAVMVIHFVKMRLDNMVATGLTIVFASAFMMHIANELAADFGGLGVLTVVLFYTMRNLRYARAGELFGLFMINAVWMGGATVGWIVLNHIVTFPAQLFGLLALPLIWKYNGTKGFDHAAIRFISYSFYPLHMLILGMLMLSGVSIG